MLSRVWLFMTSRDCSPPGSSVHEILQAGILEWVAISSPRGSQTHVFPGLLQLAGRFFTTVPPGKPNNRGFRVNLINREEPRDCDGGKWAGLRTGWRPIQPLWSLRHLWTARLMSVRHFVCFFYAHRENVLCLDAAHCQNFN